MILLFISFLGVQNIVCSDETEYYVNGNIEFCFLEQSGTLSGQALPKGTGVHFTEDGVFDWCFLQQDTEIQGHLCRGDGHSFMTSFYPNGQLRTAWLAINEAIQGIPCAKFRFFSALFAGIHSKTGQTSFYENGQLRYCELSENITIEGELLRKKEAVRFNSDGTMIIK
ncbi:MAG: hypothetical protein QF814_08965 [Candidatus Marinimicrobia bacterium]|jgi:hypothetical protein|nr:hypothetical protein [Candidatus Neomarinimicrobiota bacterium]|tara:strand:- start:2223 stop:2729 length:507 start_codon:yes stop_codon:yes gene_type:complete